MTSFRPLVPAARASHLRLALIATTGLLAACGTAADTTRPPEAWTTEVDTLPGGVARVVNTPPADGGARWTLEEQLRIGTMEGGGPASFGDVRGIVVLDDGRVAVLDAQAQEVRVFDPEGAHLATHGGRGEGPGEFLNANGILLHPDGRLVVPDERQDRLTFFDPDTGLDRVQSIVMTSWGYVYRGAMLADGRIVKPSSHYGPPRTYYLRVFSDDGATMDSIFLPDPTVGFDEDDPPTAFRWSLPNGRGGGVMGISIAERGAALFHPAGVTWTAAALAEEHRLVQTSLDGTDTLRVVETRRRPQPVAESVRDSIIDAIGSRIAEMNGDMGDQSWDKVPTRYPFVERIVAATNGDLWVETGSAEGSVWDVFSAEGVHRRTVETDLPLYPFVPPVIRGEEFWAVVRDEFDVSYVVHARLVEAGGPR